MGIQDLSDAGHGRGVAILAAVDEMAEFTDDRRFRESSGAPGI
jgi:hypothetical protein